jgi:hypothetical protein
LGGNPGMFIFSRENPRVIFSQLTGRRANLSSQELLRTAQFRTLKPSFPMLDNDRALP